MLMLSRKPGETVWIGKAMVKVYEVHEGKVRLAIDAPPDVPVVRDELLDGQQPGEWRKKGER